MPLTVGELQALLRIDDAGVSSALDQAMAGLRTLDKTWTAEVNVNAADAVASAERVDQALEGIEDEQARLTVDSGGAVNEVRGVQSALDIPDETVALKVDTSSARSSIDGVKSALGGLASLAGGVGLGAITKGWSTDFMTFEDQVSGAATATGASMQHLEEIARGFEIIPPTVAAQGINNLSQIQAAFGRSGDQALASSQSMMEVAQAASAVVGVPVAEVVDGMSSAFRGEFDSLQRVIPAISAATIEQKALEMSGKASTAELTAQEKALAAEAVILQEGAGLLKQYAANQDTQAFAVKRAADAAETASIAFGERMAPAVGFLLDLFNGMPGPMQAMVIGFGGLVALMTMLSPLFLAVTSAQTAQSVAMLAAGGASTAAGGGFMAAAAGLWALLAPLLPIVLGVGALIGVGVLLVQNWDTVKAVAGDVWGFVTNAVGSFVDFVANNWPYLLGVFGLLIKHWDTIKEAGGRFIGWVASIPGAIGDIFAGAGEWLVNAGHDIIIGLWNGFAGATDWLWNQITGFVDDMIGWVTSGFGIFSPSKVFADLGKQLPAGLAKGIMAGLPTVDDAIGSMVRLPEMSVPVPAAAGAHMGGMANGGPGDRPIVVNVAGSVVTTRDIARDVQAFLGERR
jgi:hypothetical protein